MSFSPRDKVLEYLIYYLTVGLLFPAFKAYTQIAVFWPAITLLIIIYLLNKKSWLLATKTFICVIFIFFIYYLQALTTYYKFWFSIESELLFRFYAFLVPVVLLELIISYNKKSFLIKLGRFSLILLVISGIIQIISEIQFPLVSRNAGDILNSKLYPWWVVIYTFGVLNALPFIIGMMILTIKKNYYHAVSMLLLILILLSAGFLTAFIYATALICISLLIRMNVKRFYLYCFLVLIFVMISMFKFEVLNIAKSIPNEVAQEKIYGIEEKLQTGTGSKTVESREDVYKLSLNGFLNNMWIGQGSAFKVGGHSFWLDKLSQFGILGTLSYIIFLLLMYKRTLLLLPFHLHYAFKIQLLITQVIMFFNPYGFLEFFTIIFVYAPIIGVYLYNSKSDIKKLKPFQRGLKIKGSIILEDGLEKPL